jgi:hypothetical protein
MSSLWDSPRHVGGRMRRVLLGLIGVMAAGPSHADEMYSFTTLVNGLWRQQTLIH